jgi:Ribbon-helix-helix domain
MRRTLSYTSTLPEAISKKLADYCKKHKIQKNKIIENALELYFKEERRKEFIEGVKKWGMDPENEEWAEWGMKEYAEQLKEYPA